jgi:hypothetical protein
MAKEKNRFAGFEALKSEPVEKPQIDQGKVGKSKDSNYKKVTLYLTTDLHFKLRSHSLTTTEDMSDLVEQVMMDYFKQSDS